MQISENKTIDARAFPEIWDTLTQSERTDLRSKVVAKTRCTEVTFYNWAKGATRPIAFSAQRDIAQVVSNIIGIRVLPQTLFPAR